MKIIKIVFSWLLGGVFFLAGILKLMDPVGTSLIVTEYLKFLRIPFMIPYAWWIGEILALSETIVGALVISCIWRNIAVCFSAVFLLFFTILTFTLYIVNPEMDCGCFGEALHLTHFQSFLKNIVLDLFWVIAFIPYWNPHPISRVKKVLFSITLLLTVIFAICCSLLIPPVDFTPMAPGIALFQPNGNLDDGPILSFHNQKGEYADSLATSGHVLIISTYEPQKLSIASWERIADFKDLAINNNFKFLLLSTKTPLQLDSAFISCKYIAERKTLLTLNRSNGGLTYISDGIIIDKWAARRLPTENHLKKLPLSEASKVTNLDPIILFISLGGFIITLLGLLIRISQKGGRSSKTDS